MINQYKCPIDKISTIINFCNILSTMILNQNNLLTKNNKSINENENNFKQRLAGADELLPIVVYTLIKGNVPKLKSNLNYIKLFRHNTMLDSNAEEYFITFIESGISFIEKLDDDLKGLKIDNFEEINKKISDEKNVVNYDFKEIENVKNKDENYIIYYLNEMNEKQNINLNVNSNVDKSVLNEDENFLNKIDFNKLDKEYFKNKELKEIPIFNLEKMVNDFKIILLLLKKYNNNK